MHTQEELIKIVTLFHSTLGTMMTGADTGPKAVQAVEEYLRCALAPIFATTARTEDQDTREMFGITTIHIIRSITEELFLKAVIHGGRPE